MAAPAPWPQSPWMAPPLLCSGPGGTPGRKPGGAGKRPFAAYCPWAACKDITETTVPEPLDLQTARKAQITCKACGARFAAARAWCAVCQLPPHLCGGHGEDAPRGPPPAGRRPGAFAGVGALKAAMERPPWAGVGTAGAGPLEGSHKEQKGSGAPARTARQISLATAWGRSRIASPSDKCRYVYSCSGCGFSNEVSALTVDPKGFLRPVRCKACSMAARPTAARCLACRTPWQACVARPLPGVGSAIRPAMEACQEWTLPFATDFSGMDMASYALDEMLLGGITANLCWASDVWGQARGFCSRNRSPKIISIAT